MNLWVPEAGGVIASLKVASDLNQAAWNFARQ